MLKRKSVEDNEGPRNKRQRFEDYVFGSGRANLTAKKKRSTASENTLEYQSQITKQMLALFQTLEETWQRRQQEVSHDHDQAQPQKQAHRQRAAEKMMAWRIGCDFRRPSTLIPLFWPIQEVFGNKTECEKKQADSDVHNDDWIDPRKWTGQEVERLRPAALAVSREIIFREHLRRVGTYTHNIRAIGMKQETEGNQWPRSAKLCWQVLSEFGLNTLEAQQNSEVRQRVLVLIAQILEMPALVRGLEADMARLAAEAQRCLDAVKDGRQDMTSYQRCVLVYEYCNNARRALASGNDAQLLVQDLLRVVKLWRRIPERDRSEDAMMRAWATVFDPHNVVPVITPAGLCNQCHSRLPLLLLRSQAHTLCRTCATMRQCIPALATDPPSRNIKPLVQGAMAAGIARQLTVDPLHSDTLHPLAHVPFEELSLLSAPPSPLPSTASAPSSSPTRAKNSTPEAGVGGTPAANTPRQKQEMDDGGLDEKKRDSKKKELTLSRKSTGNSATTTSATLHTSIAAALDTLEQFSDRGPTISEQQLAKLREVARPRRSGTAMGLGTLLKKAEWKGVCDKAGLSELARWHALGSWMLEYHTAPRISDESIGCVREYLLSFARIFETMQLLGLAPPQLNWNTKSFTNLLAAHFQLPNVQVLFPCAKSEIERTRDQRTFALLLSYDYAQRQQRLQPTTSLSTATPSSSLSSASPLYAVSPSPSHSPHSLASPFTFA